jgi:hypothetical protein
MNMAPLLQWVHDTALGDIARRWPWVFTTGLVLHFTGLSLLMGSMLIVDLRLLGFPRQMPAQESLKFLRVALLGFAINLLTGITFFTFDPADYWLNPAFRIKMVLVVLAGVNALYFAVTERGRLGRGHGETYTTGVKVSAVLSLALWFVIMVFGRLIVAFQGSPDLFK